MTTVLVTGASGSIGRATLAAFAARDVRLATIDLARVPEPESSLVDRELCADLTDDGAVAEAAGRLGPLAHVVAIAGGGDLEELSREDLATESLAVFARVVEANLHTAFVTIRHTVPLLREHRGDRSITLVSSINAGGGYGAPGYSAAKAGLGGLVRSLVTPLGADGIRINCVELGTVATENLRRLDEGRGIAHDLAATAARAPLRRVLEPADAAAALVAAALDMRGLTGATIVLDNGQTLIR